MKRKQKNNFIIFLIILILVIVGVYAYYFKGILTNPPSKFTHVSIKELNQNPAKYVGQKIKISGILQIRALDTLADNEGYWVWIGNAYNDEGCEEAQRDYTYVTKVYTAEGVWTAPGSSYDNNFYRVQCTSPIY
jgi:hypothetical protein